MQAAVDGAAAPGGPARCSADDSPDGRSPGSQVTAALRPSRGVAASVAWTWKAARRLQLRGQLRLWLRLTGFPFSEVADSATITIDASLAKRDRVRPLRIQFQDVRRSSAACRVLARLSA